MTTKAHSTLTGSDLHEPKGVASATSGKVYVSDGAGSGAWTTLPSGNTATTSFYTSSQTITIPTSMTKAHIRMWGGSGGAGGAASGGGGGGGGYLEKVYTGITPGNTYIFTRGSAGSGGGNDPATGGTGGSSTLASGTQTITTLTASGGSGGTQGGLGGAGGSGTNGDININGQRGADNPGSSTGGIGISASGGMTGGGMGQGGNCSGASGNGGTNGGLIIYWYV